MANSRTRNTTLSIVTSGIRQVSSILLQFVSRTAFIYVLGKEYLGLNGLFANILTLLSLSELGIGVALTFYLYKPLAIDDKERIKVLMGFYKRCYNVVGLVIFGLGCAIMPFLDKIVNFDQALPENLYVVFLLFLIQSASTYFFFAYKQSLITANQELYKIEKINILFVFLGCATDVIVLFVFKAFLPYLIAKVALVILKNLIISIKVDKEYPYIKGPCTTKLTREEKRTFFKDVYSVSLFKIGSVFLNSLSSFIISIMLGTAIVGICSNYTLIISQVTMVFMIIITAVTASVGNVIAKETKERQYEIFRNLHTYCFVICGISTICLFQLMNSFIKLWLGGIDETYVLSQAVVFFICFDYYINTSCQIHNTFRQASGNFRIGQYLQFIGGIINIILAIPLCKLFGLTGIFAAQVISKMAITNIPFLYMVEHKLFDIKLSKTVLNIFRDILITCLCGALVWFICIRLHQSTILNFVLETLIAVAFSTVFYIVIFRKSPAYRDALALLKQKLAAYRTR